MRENRNTTAAAARPAEKPVKVYVDVNVKIDRDGKLHPLSLIWEDGRTYEIDKVITVQQAPAMRAGGQGDRYRIRVEGRETYLFFERSPNLSGEVIGRWFVERRVA